MKQYEYGIHVLGVTYNGWVVVADDATKEEIEEAIIDDAIEDIWFEER